MVSTRNKICRKTISLYEADKEYSTQQQLFRELKSDGGKGLSSSAAIRKIHILNKQQKYRQMVRLQRKMQRILRECKKCKRWNRLNQIVTCSRCEDHYHFNCLPHKSRNKFFLCPSCCQQPKIKSPCNVCRKEIPSALFITCDICLNQCHASCLEAATETCKRCFDFRKSLGKVKLIRKKLKVIPGTNRNLRQMFQRMGKRCLVEHGEDRMKRSGKGFKCGVRPEQGSIQYERYKTKLLLAISQKGMKYSQDLKDIEFHLKKMKNNMQLGLANMSEEEEIQYLSYKNKPVGPFLVEKQGAKGYGVVADRNISKSTIICEYVGQVVTLRQCEQMERFTVNDSKMDLWKGKNSEEKLIIRPQKWANIGRFLNGVKNSQSSRNVDSLRVCMRGLPVILLIASRDIKRGESLVYDYNAGGIDAKYDTSSFQE